MKSYARLENDAAQDGGLHKEAVLACREQGPSCLLPRLAITAACSCGGDAERREGVANYKTAGRTFEWRATGDSAKEENRVESFCFPVNEPKVEFMMGYFHHALWVHAPAAAHTHHVLLVYTLPLPPSRPRLCSAGSDPDKLLCLQAARSSAPNISSYFCPIPQRGACLSANAGAAAAFSTCGVTGRVPVKVAAVGSLHERIGSRFFYAAAKTTASSPPGGREKTWRWHLSISNIGYFP